MNYGPISDIGIWRAGYSKEFCRLYDELHMVKMIIIGRPKWLDTCLECKKWILVEGLLFLNQKAVGV
jgi:hypothetical protein